MNNKKWGINFAFSAVLLLAACELPSPDDVIEHTATPISPSYTQLIYDCNTGEHVTPGNLIQPAPGCDSWEINRYERPFSQGSQLEFFPDLDILQAELGQTGNWFFLRIALFDMRVDTTHPQGMYAIEMDLDMDGRGDVLVLVRNPGEDGSNDWSADGVQIYEDSNNDVGNQVPLQPDLPYEGDGYDLLIYNQGIGSDPDMAWARAIPGKPAFVELAFKTTVIDNDPEFIWWVWTDQGVDDPSSFDYHDVFFHSDAGDVYESQVYFPSNDIHELDNTCAALWGAPPSDDPSLCENDPNYSRPTPTPPGGRTLTPTPPGFTPPGLVTRTPTFTPTPPGYTPPGLRTRTPTPSPTPTRPSFESTWTPSPTPTPSPTFTPTRGGGGGGNPSPTATETCFAGIPCNNPPTITPTTICSDTQGDC